MADLLAGRRNWAEVIAAAPGGIQLVAGARWLDDQADRSSAADRLIELLDDSSLGADVVVVDVGNDLGRAGQRICWAADALVMVTTSETAAVVGAFAAIKRLVRFERGCGLPDGQYGADGLGRRRGAVPPRVGVPQAAGRGDDRDRFRGKS